jgi:protein-tyrosine kinase
VTRLTDALNRASARGDVAADLAVASPSAEEADGSVGDATPRSWRLDGKETATAVAQPEPARGGAPDVSPGAFEYEIGDGAVGMVVVGEDADAGLVERFHRLGAALHNAQAQRGIRSVMVASAVAGEGKTLTAMNLALSLSHSYQRRVLLIDGDLRRPELHAMFRLENRVGLDEALKHPDVNGLPTQKITPTLCLLAAGEPNPDPMSALVSQAMKRVIVEAAQEFDWVVIDTPPVALMPDAKLLAGMIDGALLVVKAGSTPYPLARRAIEAIGEARILGVVLNHAKRADFSRGADKYRHYYRRRGKRPGDGDPEAALKLSGKPNV